MLETSAVAGESSPIAEFTDRSGPSPEDALALTEEVERLLRLVGDREQPIIEPTALAAAFGDPRDTQKNWRECVRFSRQRRVAASLCFPSLEN